MINKQKAIANRNKEGMPDELEIAIGMEVMITYNMDTELDLANGARGEIVEIIMDEEEETISPNEPIIYL